MVCALDTSADASQLAGRNRIRFATAVICVSASRAIAQSMDNAPLAWTPLLDHALLAAPRVALLARPGTSPPWGSLGRALVIAVHVLMVRACLAEPATFPVIVIPDTIAPLGLRAASSLRTLPANIRVVSCISVAASLAFARLAGTV